MRLYTPAYERKIDRVTRVVFEPRKLDGRLVATADVDDPAHVASLLKRGWLPWPGEQAPEGAPAAPSGVELTSEQLDALTVSELRELADRLGIPVPTGLKKAEIRALIPDPA